MKTWIIGAFALAITAATSAASACPTGQTGEVPRRPVVQTVSFQATELFQRAADLDAAASSHDRSAQTFEREAETLASRARVLRNQVSLVAVSDRQNVQAVADELSVRAASSRTQASIERQTAADLRAQARVARERATQLVRGSGGTGGGWGGRRPSAPTQTADTSI